MNRKLNVENVLCYDNLFYIKLKDEKFTLVFHIVKNIIKNINSNRYNKVTAFNN